MLTYSAAAVSALSLSEIQSLELIGFNSISIADTAGNIEKLDASDIQNSRSKRRKYDHDHVNQHLCCARCRPDCCPSECGH